MWYFTWILGVFLAVAFGIINVMWMETEELLGKEITSLEEKNL
jgi:cyd operon protein YbgT